MTGVLRDVQTGRDRRAGRFGADVVETFGEGSRDRRGGVALNADHFRPLGTDQAERLQFVERLRHADDSGPSSGRINDNVGQFPAALVQSIADRLGHFEAERFFPFGAPAGLLKGRDAKGSGRNVNLANALAAINDGSINQFQDNLVGMQFRRRRRATQHGQIGIRRHDDGRLEAGGDRVSRQAVAGVPLSRHGQVFETEQAGHRHGEGHAAILERQGRVRAETEMGFPLVLHLKAAF